MATYPDSGIRKTPSPTASNEDSNFPHYPRQAVAGPPSMISSRMTDIASEDGAERHPSGTAAPLNKSLGRSDSRPETARTGNTNRTAIQSQPLRRAISNKRKSLTPSTSGSVGGRPPSSASRSHVPSLTSHAFFRPMSSQKLQAQRGAGRPSTMSRPPMDGTDVTPAGSNANTPRHSVISNPIAQVARPTTQDGDGPAPPSRGTEMTEQETYDRMTANTSPQGHYTQGSLSESVRPLQKQPAANRNLTVDVDNSYRNGGNMNNLPTPRSFRSNFLLPSRNDSQQSGGNRDMRGGEKLDSVTSSPPLTPTNAQPRSEVPEPKPKELGHNYEYFDGNLVFCFGGRLLNTRNRPINLGTGTVVLVPAVLFFACQASWIWHNISPALPVTWAYVWLVTMSSLIHASASDPGVCTTTARVCLFTYIDMRHRFSHGTFISSHHQLTMTPSRWGRQLMTGPWSSQLRRPQRPWRYPPSTARRAISGVHLEPITVDSATTALRHKTTTVFGSTTAWGGAITGSSLPLSLVA
jgi:palmitoyltransferase ZDHHC9/14/18